MTWLLRRATASDLDIIMALETSTFATDAWSRASMLTDVTSAHCYYLVAFDENSPTELAGYGGLLAPHSSSDSDIQTIAVATTSRRQGLGGLLMRALISEARKRGMRNVFLEVRADNPGAERLYHQLGFERLGVRPHYYQPDNVDAIVMKLVIPAVDTAWATTATPPPGQSSPGQSSPDNPPAEASDEPN